MTFICSGLALAPVFYTMLNFRMQYILPKSGGLYIELCIIIIPYLVDTLYLYRYNIEVVRVSNKLRQIGKPLRLKKSNLLIFDRILPRSPLVPWRVRVPCQSPIQRRQLKESWLRGLDEGPQKEAPRSSPCLATVLERDKSGRPGASTIPAHFRWPGPRVGECNDLTKTHVIRLFTVVAVLLSFSLFLSQFPTASSTANKKFKKSMGLRLGSIGVVKWRSQMA